MKTAKLAGEYSKYTKKEKLLIDREIIRLERYFSGIKGLDRIPELLIVFDIRKEKGAIKEANFKGVETVAIVDTNCDPTLVDYPVPMNDDAKKALEYVLDLMGEAVMEGKGIQSKSMSKSKVKDTTK